jgi:hypothetical protein
MMKLVSLVLAGALLASCAHPTKVLTRDVYRVITPPDAMYVCPQIKAKDWPHPEMATNQEIADFIAKLYEYNRKCGVSLVSIKGYIKAAEKRLQQQGKD